MIASWSASRVRAPTRRKMAFSLENASSIGERSGEYEGRNRSWQPPFFDGLFDLGPLMDRQIVQDHDLSWTQAGSQDLLDIRLKGRSIRRTIQHQRFAHARERQRRESSVRFAP